MNYQQMKIQDFVGLFYNEHVECMRACESRIKYREYEDYITEVDLLNPVSVCPKLCKNTYSMLIGKELETIAREKAMKKNARKLEIEDLRDQIKQCKNQK
jgi:hypothetical protein